jgi:histidine triad (HIT) family protein
MTNDCLFCRIARREIACHVVHEDEDVLAFLDIHPIRPGHTLVIPRAHYPWFEDMPPELAGKIMTLSQRLAREMKALYPVERVAMLYTGIHVNHAHAHLVPMHHRHDITSAAYLGGGAEEFTLPAQPPAQELERGAAALRERLSS